MHSAYVTSSRGGDGLRHHYIDLVIESGLAARGGDALDLGCGTGTLATMHLAEHFRVTGVDISPPSIEVARSEVPGADFVVGDMASVDFGDDSFDLVTAFYSLIHVPRDEHAVVLDRVASWLRPGGVLVVTMGAGGGDDTEEPDWLGVPMYWSNWDARTNVGLVEAAGFEVLRATTEHTIEDTRPVPFLWVVAQVPAKQSATPPSSADPT